MAIALAILVPPFVTYSDVLFGATENQERASAAAASCGLEDAGWGRVPPPGGKDDTFLAGPVRRMPIIPLLAECPCGFLLKTTVTAALSLSGG